ncbi:MAG: hypothetical protein Kow0069_33200 [Promethearchaeota archaeon]
MSLDYGLGVAAAIAGGSANFAGQVLIKKGINDTPPERRNDGLIRSLVRNPTWVAGMVLLVGVGGVLLLAAQLLVGAALVPGLTAFGLAVLAVGSVKLLGEKLRKAELLAIFLLGVAITLVGLSGLSIEPSLERFSDPGFRTRVVAWSVAFGAAWAGFFVAGKRAERYGAIYLAVGAGLPFVLGNLWMQPLVLAMTRVFGGNYEPVALVVLVAGGAVEAVANVLGLAHFQYALNAGNATIVVPVQQAPQQVAPVVIYFFIYRLAPPAAYSLPFLVAGMVLVVVCGFLLSRRQAQLERIKA